MSKLFVKVKGLWRVIAGGEKGDKGDAGTVQVGTVSTLPAGSLATVNNSGSETAAVLDFGIPQGDITALISVGKVTTLAEDSNATVTNSGDGQSVILDFGIPKGAKGASGSPSSVLVDYSKGVSQSVTVASTTSPYQVKCTASIDGMLVFSGNPGNVNSYSANIILIVNNKQITVVQARYGNNNLHTYVSKGDVCVYQNPTAAWTNYSATIFPFK